MFRLVLKRLFILVSCSLIQACSSTALQESTGQYIDSAAVTTKVKARLFDGLGSDAIAIKVKTYKQTVQLSGFVNHVSIKQRAGRIANNTLGVKYVQNDLIVKPVPRQTSY